MLNDSIDVIHLEVGGLRFSLLPEDIAKHPECLFAILAKREWRQNQEEVVKIDRDGRLFRYVYAFMISGYLPKEVLSTSELESLFEEADYYNLPDLIQACDTKNISECIELYKGVRKYCDNIVYKKDNVSIDYIDSDNNLLQAVKNIPVPNSVFQYPNEKSFCIFGEWSHCIEAWHYRFTYEKEYHIYKSSSTRWLHIDELIADATPSPFGHGPHTVFNTNIGNSLEIPASILNQDAMQEMCEQLAPLIHWSDMQAHLQLRPYKLVIYQEGGYCEAHRDIVRGDGHIGILELILSFEYTGRELEIARNSNMKLIKGPFQWVAMYGACSHRILPAVSGTRVSLLFDIHLAPGGCLRPSADISTLRAEQERLVAAVQAELQSHEAVSICLEHMYPAAQAVSGYLKGRDGVLFELLQDVFTIEVVFATIFSTTTQIYDPQCDEEVESEEFRVWFIRSFLHHTGTNIRLYNKQKVKFIIPNKLNKKTLLNKDRDRCDKNDKVHCNTALLIRRDNKENDGF